MADRALPLAALVALLCATVPARADSVSTSTAGGYARLLFRLTPAARATESVTEGTLTLSFDRKIAVDPASLAQGLPGYIGSARADADGKAFHFALSQPVRVHTSSAGDDFALDLLPSGFAGTPPDLPPRASKPVALPDPGTLAPVKMRVGSYRNFTRLVFDWPKQVPYSVFPGTGKLTLRFGAMARPDFAALARQSPPWVKNAAWHTDGKNSIIVEFETDTGAGFHDFRDGNRIVVDVLAPKTDADAYAPPGAANVRPAIHGLSNRAAPTPEQRIAIAAAAASLNGTGAPQTPQPPASPPGAAVPPPAAPASPPDPATEGIGASTPAAGTVVAAEGRVTRDGAVVTFAGASRRGSAVFIRGNTAWIVLQDAPPIDAARLKAQLGGFPAGVEASMADGVSVVRIALKRPEQIAAFADGSNLKVVIASQVVPGGIAIRFARNVDDSSHATLTTLLPGAAKIVTVTDPDAGDTLILVPAAAGRSLLQERNYTAFQALKTASGLVLAPLVDDLSIAVDVTRVTIARPGGLGLAPPEAAAANSPSALAGGKDGSSYLDLAAWADTRGASFLSAERRLRTAAARLGAGNAAHARLALARFYIAHRFAAEALGVVNLMQASDPALQSDRQLQVIRAAANYEMGRYRDAHNDIAGTAFDSDPHAAFWRGLIDAALEDWKSAQADLERAAPVLKLYPAEWKARADLAGAAAALGRGRLEIADAALARLPDNLPAALRIEAQLQRARLLAAESREDEAAKLFSAVEKSGRPREAAQAIYYRVVMGLGDASIPAPKAIAELEALRYRWRGDSLEVKTLRKLGSLYFAGKKWRDGLHCLRIAAENFPSDDLAREAQDDMRSAFVDLFLKGKADGIAPVEALSLFYDNLDLTPIGPDGDEMIRRMSDRLVAVDLLEPAEDLLKYQVEKRLDGVARAQVATRLAGIYLLDRKPDLAVAEIRTTQISTLPDDVRHQRMLIEARALAAMRRWDDALDMISVDQGSDTARLRADIYWESGNWPTAGQEAELALGGRWNDAAPLTAEERQQVMRAAVAYSLANDQTSLDRLREHFRPKMKTGPDAHAFDVVSDRIDAHGAGFRDAAAQVASIDTLKSFMKDMRAQGAPSGTN
ncbi:MAG TPA: hypothetical protein VG819_11950 [Rhizomicrobium sp.]|nr:hypothetical protein [Rhizomicrobium sp.]